MQEDDVEKKAGEESEKLKKKGDCNKNQEKNQVKRFKNKSCKSPEKPETQSDET